MRGGLEPGQIRAIRHLVATAVEGLKPERVSIVDESGALLADGAGSQQPEGGSDDRQAAFERRLSEQVQRIVESVVGGGRARVQVAAELDFNRITQTQDLYDPDSKVVRSTLTREENAATGGRDQSVTVGNELPNATGQASAAPGAQDLSKKSEETVNYEISRTTRTETIDAGRVKRISVAVLVDGTYARDGTGAVSYAPRAKEDLDRIGALVRSSIGYDQKRGDQLEVVNLRFAEAPPSIEAAAELGWASYLNLQPGRHRQADRARRPRRPFAPRAPVRGAPARSPRPVARRWTARSRGPFGPRRRRPGNQRRIRSFSPSRRRPR